jgi:hypothetical protein
MNEITLLAQYNSQLPLCIFFLFVSSSSHVCDSEAERRAARGQEAGGPRTVGADRRRRARGQAPVTESPEAGHRVVNAERSAETAPGGGRVGGAVEDERRAGQR